MQDINKVNDNTNSQNAYKTSLASSSASHEYGVPQIAHMKNCDAPGQQSEEGAHKIVRVYPPLTYGNSKGSQLSDPREL